MLERGEKPITTTFIFITLSMIATFCT